MGFLLRRLLAYGRWVSLAAATSVAGAVYAVLSTREQIAPFGGEPHVIEWWEPYTWAAVAFVVVNRGLRMILGRFAAAAGAHMARIRRGDVFGPRP